MNTKQELITRLIKEDKITLDEAMLLMEDYGGKGKYVNTPNPRYYPTDITNPLSDTIPSPFMHVIDMRPHHLVDYTNLPAYLFIPTTC